MPVMPHRIIRVIAYCFFIVKCPIKTASIHDHWFVHGWVSPPRWWTYMIHKRVYTHTHTYAEAVTWTRGCQNQICLPGTPTLACWDLGLTKWMCPDGQKRRRDWRRRVEGGGLGRCRGKRGKSPRAAGWVWNVASSSVTACEHACLSVCTVEHCLY